MTPHNPNSAFNVNDIKYDMMCFIIYDSFSELFSFGFMAKLCSFPKFMKMINNVHYHIFILHKREKKLSNSASFLSNKSLNIFQENTFPKKLFGKIKLLVIWLYDLQVGCSVGWFFGFLITWLVEQLGSWLVVWLSIILVFWVGC